jgi:benzoate transport
MTANRGNLIDTIADERSRWNNVRVLVVFLCFLLNMLDGTDLLIMSFVAPVLADNWTVSPEHLGVLFSASLAGMAIGCLVVAPMADRFGRRALIIAALATVAAAMVASAFTRSVSELMLARLVVGVGVGTIGVSMTAMAAEYAPERYTNFAVGFVQAGWPFGSIITAVFAARLLPVEGWRVLFVGVGILSGVLLLGILAFMPESLAFLSIKRPVNALRKINAIRARLALRPLEALPAARPRLPGSRVAALFDDARAVPSALLWTAVTLGYFDLYFVISWIPKLATQAGLPLTEAIYAGGSYNLGAFLGTSAMGWIAVRQQLTRVIAVFFALAAVAMLIFGAVAMPVWLTLLMALLVGATVQGGFNGFWGLAARLYPPEMRSTGIGWALGVGRIGAVLGPVAGGLLVGAQATMAAIFALFAIPLVVAAALTLKIKLT